MLNQATLAWQVARKDLRLFFADRRGAVFFFAVPVLLASMFGVIFQGRGASGAADRLRVTVVAEDPSPATRRVVEALLACDRLEAVEADRATALARLGDRGAGAVVVLPGHFGDFSPWDQAPGRPRQVAEILYHPNSAIESHWAEGILTEVVFREVAGQWLAPLTRANPGLRLERPFEVTRSPVGTTGSATLDVYSHSFCGMALQYLLFWGMDSGLLLLRERRLGIWKRLRAAPVPLATLLAGKTLATALVALTQIAVTFGFGRLVFGVGVNGSVLGFVALSLSAAGLSAAIGLLVAALGGNECRARSVAVVAILVLAMLGGMWLPSFLLPGWVQQAALGLPTTWAVRGFEGVTWQGMGLGPALRCAGVLGAFSAAFLAASWAVVARSEARRVNVGGVR